ncbi:GLPGLI family protein [Flavobacterium phragmitis]|uniref:GLPGLI family protein n=1 Tax=Flavobacterium phragmitis TaxID=739143 RepID=A0A1I1QTU9_9FLAO|nr:GLPGLI family protein [Flavobacterium phragmitis]SFD25536.1 GLPGLI family protein [Flavobacterium phragmitis]
MRKLNAQIKRIIWIVIINFIFINSLSSQVTRVIYKNSLYGGDINTTKLPPEKMKVLSAKQIELLDEVMKNEANMEFELLYNKEESLYQKIEKLDISEKPNFTFPSNNAKYYKNLTNKIKLYQTESSVLYNVIVPFEQYKWNITTETKEINGYKCYKATTTYEDLYNPRKDRKLIFNPVVWFTPDIPASFGPKGLDGLPGLVLEGTINGKKYIYATKIEFDYKKIKEIEKPKGGKNLTEKEFENIMIENFKRDQ